MQGDQVTSLKQFIERDILRKIQVRILVHIIGNDLHAKAAADSCHGCADLTGSHNPRCLLVEIKSHKSAEAEIIFPHFYISLMDPAVCGEGQSHGMLRHRLR